MPDGIRVVDPVANFGLSHCGGTHGTKRQPDGCVHECLVLVSPKPVIPGVLVITVLSGVRLLS